MESPTIDSRRPSTVADHRQSTLHGSVAFCCRTVSTPTVGQYSKRVKTVPSRRRRDAVKAPSSHDSTSRWRFNATNIPRSTKDEICDS